MELILTPEIQEFVSTKDRIKIKNSPILSIIGLNSSKNVGIPQTLADDEISGTELISRDPAIFEKLGKIFRLVTCWDREAGAPELQKKALN